MVNIEVRHPGLAWYLAGSIYLCTHMENVLACYNCSCQGTPDDAPPKYIFAIGKGTNRRRVDNEFRYNTKYLP
jgi:hypothetical protein